MPQVQMWKASDGTIFDNQKEHDDHESRLEDGRLVDAFLDAQQFAKPAVRTKARNAIMGFLDWRNRDVPAEPKEAEAA